MVAEMDLEAVRAAGGASGAIRGMNQYSREEIGRKTWLFVRRCMQDPELRAKNNPYSQRIGEQILEAKKKAKTQASTTEDFETFGDVVMGQIMGNG